MQMIDLATVKAAKAADRRALAILAHDNATADPDAANWRAVSDMLRMAMPVAKAKVSAADPLSPFAPWADYEIPQNATGKRLGKSPIIVVTFADSEIVRAPAVSLPGKPINIGRGLRIAVAFYRGRLAARAGGNSDTSDCIMVPDLVSVVCESNGTEYDAADCTARTATKRAGTFNMAAVVAASLDRPERSTDDTLTRSEFVRASYRLAIARMQLANMPEGDDSRPIKCEIERFSLLLEGLNILQIKVKQRSDDEAERKAAAVIVAPAFKVARRFLNSTHLTVAASRTPVAPSSARPPILRIVA